MIAKLQSIHYTTSALLYCERGGELLTTNKCLGNGREIAKQMLLNNSFNDRCEANTYHIKIRMAPEDKGLLNNQDWIDISHIYATKHKFEDHMYAVYIHEEGTESEHIHIVASRIGENNLAVSDSFTHYKNMDFCREMERKYKLRKVERVLEKAKNKEVFQRNDKRMKPLEKKIKIAIGQSDHLIDLEFHLKNIGVTLKIGRGISFKDEDGVYYKGSSINRSYSLKGIKELLSYNQQEKRSIAPAMKQKQESVKPSIKFKL
ncbi:Relaxase/Mobilisation nuclease domain-containing protein [Nonlabens sp. Hel1_33_55]|uniref:relaxase/mobilization nuclease domain-containing protein n=1 Tax=Nonlabens sp. Hel1_33_55 TaxID=1336802 RepID=UPI000875AC54|nr:relaxase/mobilization nuclease domain-containing protein [Nonlabens sp. Hel1_33_55]SCY00593.1 Relaxase/Mobilisation nuclease domain-containing protein [Nonlabens sp. Hel1_33_55]